MKRIALLSLLLAVSHGLKSVHLLEADGTHPGHRLVNAEGFCCLVVHL
jgi:hypothetical protein